MSSTPRPVSLRPAAARSGFTLIELLTVIAIIGILAAILIPTVGKVRKTAKSAQCASNLRQWGQAINLYSNDNKGTYFIQGRWPDPTSPNSLGWASAVSDPELWPYGRYLSASTNAFNLRFCPLYTKPFTGNNPVSYAITRPRTGNTIAPDTRNAPFRQIRTPSQFLLLIDSDPALISTTIWVSSLSDANARVLPTLSNAEDDRHEGGLNALFADGHVKRLTAADVIARGDMAYRTDN